MAKPKTHQRHGDSRILVLRAYHGESENEIAAFAIELTPSLVWGIQTLFEAARRMPEIVPHGRGTEMGVQAITVSVPAKNKHSFLNSFLIVPDDDDLYELLLNDDERAVVSEIPRWDRLVLKTHDEGIELSMRENVPQVYFVGTSAHGDLRSHPISIDDLAKLV